MICMATCSVVDMDQAVPGARAVSTGVIPAQHSTVPGRSP